MSTSLTPGLPDELDLRPLRVVQPTTLRTELPDPAPTDERRRVSSTTAEDRFVVAGSWVAGLALAWVICQRLMPWSGLLPLAVCWFFCGLLVLAVASALTTTDVRDRLATGIVTAAAGVVGFALLSTVVFIFVRGAQALPHLNMYVDDMSGVGPRDPFTRGGILHAIVGTAIEITVAVVVTVPLGIGTAVFLTDARIR